MTTKVIAVCGAPQAGKSELLLQISKMVGAPAPRWDQTPDRFAQISFDFQDMRFTLQAATGALFSKERMIAHVLSNADIVLYVISAKSSEADEQRTWFQKYSKLAVALGKHWDSIPWLFALNKTDLGRDNPLSISLPLSRAELVVSCVANSGFGVDLLWQRLLSRVL